MVFKKSEIEGVVIEKLIKFSDERGFLVETFRIDNLPDDLQPVMSYVSYTRPGVARGPHEHFKQTDVFCFIGPGNFIIKLWDNRKESKTFGCCMKIVGGKDNPIRIIVPPGVVHGYKNISKKEIGMSINSPDKLYQGWDRKENVDEIRHENNKQSIFKMID
jgi:dTDP-4-dehydrorhamnose 3,5-epimerase